MPVSALLLIHDTANETSYQIRREISAQPISQMLQHIRYYVTSPFVQDIGTLITAITLSGVDVSRSSKFFESIENIFSFSIDVNEGTINSKAYITPLHVFEGIVEFEGFYNGSEDYLYEFFVRDIGIGIEIFHIKIQDLRVKKEIIYQGEWHKDLFISFLPDDSMVANYPSEKLIWYSNAKGTPFYREKAKFAMPDKWFSNLPVGNSQERKISMSELEPPTKDKPLIDPYTIDERLQEAKDKRIEDYLSLVPPSAFAIFYIVMVNPDSIENDIELISWSSEGDTREALVWLYLNGYVDKNSVGRYNVTPSGIEFHESLKAGKNE